jgi:hypothetical protein
MFKNKKITYLLMVLVILIWGLIFYKIYSKFGDKNQVERILPTSAIHVENRQQDSVFTLSLDYPDPFLKGVEQSSDKSLMTTTINTSDIKVVNWPLIEYRGLLTNSNGNESTGLLRVQSTDHLVKLGKVYAAIIIRTITEDSIFLEYQNESRWFPILKQ